MTSDTKQNPIKRYEIWIRKIACSIYPFSKNYFALMTTIGVVAVLILTVLITIYKWDWLIGNESGSAVIRNFLIVIATIIAFPLALWRIHVARLSILYDRLQKGVELLGHNSESVRIGGICVLENLAKEKSDQFHIQVVQTISAFIRTSSQKPNKENNLNKAAIKPSTEDLNQNEDIYEAMNYLGKRTKKQLEIENKHNFKPNIRDAKLVRLGLLNLNLSSIYMFRIKLLDSVFFSVNMSRTKMLSANIEKTTLHKVNLEESDLTDSKLKQVDLNSTNLKKAKLNSSTITNTDFHGVVLEETDLSGTRIIEPRNLTQFQLDKAISNEYNLPEFKNAYDANTGKPLIWRGGISV